MNDQKTETIKFQSKSEIIYAIHILTALCPKTKGSGDGYNFAIEKIMELTKLL